MDIYFNEGSRKPANMEAFIRERYLSSNELNNIDMG